MAKVEKSRSEPFENSSILDILDIGGEIICQIVNNKEKTKQNNVPKTLFAPSSFLTFLREKPKSLPFTETGYPGREASPPSSRLCFLSSQSLGL
jgi:hypothetical protein